MNLQKKRCAFPVYHHYHAMKLATELAIGFGGIRRIALILGGMPVTNLNGVKGTAGLIQDQNAPEVAVHDLPPLNSINP